VEELTKSSGTYQGNSERRGMRMVTCRWIIDRRGPAPFVARNSFTGESAGYFLCNVIA